MWPVAVLIDPFVRQTIGVLSIRIDELMTLGEVDFSGKPLISVPYVYRSTTKGKFLYIDEWSRGLNKGLKETVVKKII